MTPERFGELLRRPRLLDGQNATELEELIAAHPWCGPLRLLRYRKAVLDEAPDLDLWRARTEPFLRNATVESDERALRDVNPVKAHAHFEFAPPVYSETVPEGGDEHEETTASEGVDINSTVAEAIGVATAILRQVTAQTGAPEPLPESGTDLAEGTATTNGPTQAYDLAACIFDGAAAVTTADWYLHRNGLIMEYGRPKPAPIEGLESYKVWKQRRARTSWNELLMLGIDPPEPKSKRKGAGKSRPELIEPEVASETLADLLAAQGHADKAIRMYEQLSLRYPAKSASFASRIQALQQQEA